MVFTLFLFLVSVNINKKIVKTQNDLLKIDEISSNLSSLEHNSANLTRAIIVTGLYEKEEEYNKMIKEINHIIMEVQIKEVDLEILKNLKELSSLNELISEIEVNSIKESKENNVIIKIKVFFKSEGFGKYIIFSFSQKLIEQFFYLHLFRQVFFQEARSLLTFHFYKVD